MIAAGDALQILKDGNARFVAGEKDPATLRYEARRRTLRDHQEPFAIVLGCSDSRVPVEIVFDQGLGDMFVVRVAGNLVAPSQLGSIEFAASVLGARLVVVLGHTHCGAIDAALKTVRRGTKPMSDNLQLIVDEIRPSAERVGAQAGSDADQAALLDRVGRENVRHSVEKIRRESGIIKRLAAEEGLEVVGAEYSLSTGVVDFF